ncbi:MAG: 50S ribosomal protein L23 [Eubacteriales bacterium]|jgi:large subunit ribosomal protein L23|nr:50S ribosomal protein L23 [Bacillota bacterium]MBV1728193.1 50S ribosomal protein L23 [Desulforudis sp.]MDP3051724.1 50S ribosomal protein L23 [Eubacteriales bacterium]MDQ7790193.1 50S ribosomal protein L23 [Clostridia bacterium]MBU4533912.1 50S ribosomal protein L23 [Bacillota bacterium]
MKFAQDILIKPMITEKSTSLLEGNKYTFQVDPRSNKSEIKRAVEELFKVKVLDVHTLRVKGKLKRRRNAIGRTPEKKKAIVTLKPGDKIEIFEGV